MTDRNDPWALDTQLIHAGEPMPRIEGSVSMPIFQSANFVSDNAGDYDGVRYLRLNNTPNHLAVHQKLAAVEHAEAALVTASGMAAISAIALTFLKQGDHILAQRVLYGGTYDLFLRHLPDWGIDVSWVDSDAPATWADQLRPNSKMFYVETIGNPMMDVPDLAAVVQFCQANNLLSVIDNTLASPVNFCPLPFGFDVSVHSATKYLNGHSDVVAGAIMSSAARIKKVTKKLNLLGACLDTHACFLLHRGMKTMGLRVQAQNHNALTLAQFLSNHPAVAQVNYPGLPQHPQHARAKHLLAGFGGMLSFELTNGVAATERFVQRLRLPIEAASLGGVESLITLPAKTSHALLTGPERAHLGIADHLIRISVGIENSHDLMSDFAQALRD